MNSEAPVFRFATLGFDVDLVDLDRLFVRGKVQAQDADAATWLRTQLKPTQKVAVTGYGEGGLLAFFSAAAEPRIDACLVSGYFGPHSKPWEEPIYRHVWSLHREFGDAEIATLITLRTLVVDRQ